MKALIFALASCAATDAQSACSISGTTRDSANGAPVAGVRVFARARSGTDTVFAESTRLGRFCIQLENGYRELMFFKAGYVPRQLKPAESSPQPSSGRTESGFRGLTVQLVPAGVIEGKVVDSNGIPVPGVAIRYLRNQVPGLTQSGRDPQPGHTDQAGVFRLHTLEPGVYYLRASVPGRLGRFMDGFGGKGPQWPIPDGLMDTYYGDTTPGSGASGIELKEGEQVHSVVITLANTPASTR